MYRIYQFGSTPLPPAMPEDDLSTGEVESTLVDSVGGVYDAWGLNRRLPRRQTINLRGMYDLFDNGRFPGNQPIFLINELGDHIVTETGGRIIVDYPALAMRRNRDLLFAQEGTTQALYRLREDDNTITFKMARLLRVGYVRTIEDAGSVAHIEMVFETKMAAWQYLNPLAISAALPAALALTNSGDLTVTDPVLTVFTGTGLPSPITITGNGIDLSVALALSAGQTLVIDGRDQTIRVNGVDHYVDLIRGVGHTIAGWLSVPVGTSLLTVTAISGTGTATMSYYEKVF